MTDDRIDEIVSAFQQFWEWSGYDQHPDWRERLEVARQTWMKAIAYMTREDNNDDWL